MSTAGPSRPRSGQRSLVGSSQTRLPLRLVSTSSRHVTILGAGLTGLYTAYRLSESPDIRVTVLESADRVGGWVDSRNHPVSFKDKNGRIIEGAVTLESGPRSIRPKGSRGAPTMLKLVRDASAIGLR